ncbi:MAG: hypothetical protein NT002_13010 [candidate division Zixibacteria bacterium]|nr:hypothetical protein [candidate division Zixibacteria bacterium]
MNSRQYEELCRRFLAIELGLPIDNVRSIDIPNPRCPDLPEYRHQIDLYWEICNNVTLYLNIANAKWRTAEKVDQGEVMLLQKVREKVRAHKCVMITNIDFTQGARAAAQDEGVALHIVRPTFDNKILDESDRPAIQVQFERHLSDSKQLFSHEVVFKGFDLASPMLQQIADHTVIVQAARINEIADNTNRIDDGGPSNKSIVGTGHANGRSVGENSKGGTGADYRQK